MWQSPPRSPSGVRRGQSCHSIWSCSGCGNHLAAPQECESATSVTNFGIVVDVATTIAQPLRSARLPLPSQDLEPGKEQSPPRSPSGKRRCQFCFEFWSCSGCGNHLRAAPQDCKSATPAANSGKAVDVAIIFVQLLRSAKVPVLPQDFELKRTW